MPNLKHYIQEAVPFIFTTIGVVILTLALMQSCLKQVDISAAPAMREEAQKRADHYKDAKGEPQMRWVEKKGLMPSEVDTKKEKK